MTGALRRRILRLINAVRPPVPVALPAMTAAVAMHTGHIGFSCKSGATDLFYMKGGGSSALGPQLAGTGTLSRRR